mmetsp:Transcript_5669/g.14115  ORF Transcript_5669/g.14115 Transcript_5669/m.14115 type:complete len:306 (-) Transcript_5669:212-1129(-)
MAVQLNPHLCTKAPQLNPHICSLTPCPCFAKQSTISITLDPIPGATCTSAITAIPFAQVHKQQDPHSARISIIVRPYVRCACKQVAQISLPDHDYSPTPLSKTPPYSLHTQLCSPNSCSASFVFSFHGKHATSIPVPVCGPPRGTPITAPHSLTSSEPDRALATAALSAASRASTLGSSTRLECDLARDGSLTLLACSGEEPDAGWPRPNTCSARASPLPRLVLEWPSSSSPSLAELRLCSLAENTRRRPDAILRRLDWRMGRARPLDVGSVPLPCDMPDAEVCADSWPPSATDSDVLLVVALLR